MLSTLLVSAVALAAEVESGAPLERPAALELVVRVEESRLCLFNPTDAPELVVLAAPGHEPRATVAVPAHTALEYRFVSRALDGLEITIYARGDDGLHKSRSVSFDELRSSTGEQTTSFVACGDHVHPWVRDGLHWIKIDPPDAGHGSLPCNTPNPPASTHVPAITPSDCQRANLPPRLEKKPLPPV
jgi:hypothetical protein